MLRFILFTLVSLNTFLCCAQDSVIWKKTYGNRHNDIMGKIIHTTDKGSLLYGMVKQDLTIQSNGFDWGIYKLDSCGNKQWEKLFISDMPGGGELYSVQQTLDKGFLLAGISVRNSLDFPVNYGSLDPWVFKLDSLGNQQWKKNMGSTRTDYWFCSYVLADSSYLLGGTYNHYKDFVNPLNSTEAGRLTRLDKNGNVIWDKIIDRNIISRVIDIKVSPENKIVITGFSENIFFPNLPDYFLAEGKLAQFSINGDMEWNITIGGPKEELIRSILIDRDNNIFLTGYTDNTTGEFAANHGSYEIFLFKFDKYGRKIWIKMIGGSRADMAFDMKFLNPGNIVITGFSTSRDGDFSTNNGNTDAFVLKVDTAGNILKNICFGGTGYERAYSIAVNEDESCVIGGYAGPTDLLNVNGISDLFIVKFKDIPVHNVDTVICKPMLWQNTLIIADTSILISTKDVCGNNSFLTRYRFFDSAVHVSTIADTSIDAGAAISLATQADAPISWTSDADLSCLYCASPVVKPNTTKTFIVNASNHFCSTSDTVTVYVKERPEGFYVPSAFTPNQDGVNDLFRVFGNAATYQIKIFNRWGQLVYTSNDIQHGWDGKYKGKPAYADVYSYLINYTLRNNPKPFLHKGTVSLLQ